MTTEIPQFDMAYSKEHIQTVWKATVIKDYYKSYSVHPALGTYRTSGRLKQVFLIADINI